MESVHKIAVVDLETTGPNIEKDDRILQIGAVIIEEGKIIARHSMYINPQRSIPKHIQKLTGITLEKIKDAPTIDQVIGLWFKRLEGCIFVAHNLAFDLRILKHVFSQHRMEYNPLALDSVTISKIMAPDANGFNLTDLSHYYDFDFLNAHDALADAEITAQLMSKFAQKVHTLSQETLNSLNRYLKYFEYQEYLFFNQPDLFILNPLNQDEIKPNKTKSTDKRDKIIQIQSYNIVQKWREHPYLIIEDTDRIVNKTLIQTIIEQEYPQHKFLIVIPALTNTSILDPLLTELPLEILKSSYHYLHLEKFEMFLKYFDPKSYNQQELLLICATIHWLSYTEDGDYQEINQELQIENLLRRKLPTNYRPQKHEYFQKAIMQAEMAQIVVIDQEFLWYMSQTDFLFKKFCQRKLVMPDIISFLETGRSYNQNQLYLSKLITELRSFVIDINYWINQNKFQHIRFNMHDLLQSVDKLQDLLIQNLSQSEIDANIQEEFVHFYLHQDKPDLNFILEAIENLGVSLNTELNELKHEKVPDRIQTKIDELNDFMRQIRHLTRSSDRHYYFIEAKRIRDNFYMMKLTRKPLIFSHDALLFLTAFQAVLLISPGNFSFRETFGYDKWLNLREFNFYKIPTVDELLRQELIIPLEYVADDQDSIRLQLMADFLDEHRQDLSQTLIIIVANQTQVDILYKLLMTSSLTDKYQIMGQGVSGSLHRIRRRILEQIPNIVILKRKAFFKEQWTSEDNTIDILLYNLPFHSPYQVEIQAMNEYLERETKQEISLDQIQIPLMVENFKILVANINNNYHVGKFYFFDGRLYTKYYGPNVIKLLEKIIEFKLLE